MFNNGAFFVGVACGFAMFVPRTLLELHRLRRQRELIESRCFPNVKPKVN